MTAGDLAAVVVTVCVIGVVVAMLYVLHRLTQVLDQLTETAERLSDHTLPAVQELRRTVDHADVELDRLSGVISTAETMSTNLTSAGRVAARAVTTPGIKTRAFAAGTRGALSRLRFGASRR
jgi:predicted PurR-regulated permease PerM